MDAEFALVERFAQQILRGAWRPGERLPSLRQLRRTEGISLVRAAQVYAELVDRGLVLVRDRAGYFIAHRSGDRPALRDDRVSTRGGAVGPGGVTADAGMDAGFGALVAAVLGSKPADELVSFSAAYPGSDLFPIEELHRELRLATRLHHPQQFIFGDASGHIALRQQIARRHLLGGEVVGADDVVCTTGGLDALLLALAACTEPGVSHVGVESPAFYPILQALQRYGLKARFLRTDLSQGLDVEYTLHAMRQRRVQALVLTPTFNNPLGTSIVDAGKQALAEASERYAIPIIENDPYRDLHFFGHRPASIKTFDRAGWVLYCGSFSNTLAPGYNAGWLVAGRFAAKVRELRFFSNMTAGMLPQRAIAAFLGRRGAHGSFEQHVVRLRDLLRERMVFGVSRLEASLADRISLVRPQGGFMIWLQLPASCSAMAIYQEARAAGVGIAPGALYGLDPTMHANALALNFGWDWDVRRREALDRLIEIIAARMP